jgi:hypothetical protein
MSECNGQTKLNQKKKKMGRPTLAPKERKSAYLRVNLRKQEAKACEKLAKREGKTFSSWARGIILNAISSDS